MMLAKPVFYRGKRAPDTLPSVFFWNGNQIPSIAFNSPCVVFFRFVKTSLTILAAFFCRTPAAFRTDTRVYPCLMSFIPSFLSARGASRVPFFRHFLAARRTNADFTTEPIYLHIH